MKFELNKDAYENLPQTAKMSIEEAVEMRLQGHLPILDICGHPFYIDISNQVLRPKGSSKNSGLDLKFGGKFDVKKKRYNFFYHIASKSEIIIRHDITKLPKGVVLIRFPSVYALDPIGVAQKQESQDDLFWQKYPMKMYSKAEVIPLERSFLANVVKRNLKAKSIKKRKVKQRRI